MLLVCRGSAGLLHDLPSSDAYYWYSKREERKDILQSMDLEAQARRTQNLGNGTEATWFVLIDCDDTNGAYT